MLHIIIPPHFIIHIFPNNLTLFSVVINHYYTHYTVVSLKIFW